MGPNRLTSVPAAAEAQASLWREPSPSRSCIRKAAATRHCPLPMRGSSRGVAGRVSQSRVSGALG
jgi:hypothetical protein